MRLLICCLCLVDLQKLPLSISFLSASSKKLSVFADDIVLSAISLSSAFGSYFVFFYRREFEILRRVLCCTPVQALNSHTVTHLSNTPSSSSSFFCACLLHTPHIWKLCRHLLLLFLQHFINGTSASTSRLWLCVPPWDEVIFVPPSDSLLCWTWCLLLWGWIGRLANLTTLKNREDVKTKAGFPERFVSCIQVTFKDFQREK